MRQRLEIIQGWRAFAALAVVFYHSVEAVAQSNPEGYVPRTLMDMAWLGNFGVDIFFVMSGFIMIYAHYDDFHTPGSQVRFLSNRFKRIVPTYWLLTSLALLVIWLMPDMSQHGRTLDLPWIIASFLFVPWTSDAGISLPVLGLGWTLNYEMYFYLWFSFALCFVRKLGVLLLVLLFSLSIAVGIFNEVEGPFFKQVTSWLLFEFLVGVAIGLAYKSGRVISTTLGILLLSFIIPFLLTALEFREQGTLPQYLRFLFFGLPAAAIISASTLCERIRKLRMPAIMVLLGDASYSLYLTHLFTVPATIIVLSNIGLAMPLGTNVLILTTVSMGVAIMFYKLIEVPIYSGLRRAKQARFA